MRKIIETGETLRLYLAYTDIDSGAALDPSTLVCVVSNPDDTLTTITYPSVDFVREAAGFYFIRISAAQSGTHAYKITAVFASGDIDIRDGKFDSEPSL
jgi:hypothetical protein